MKLASNLLGYTTKALKWVFGDVSRILGVLLVIAVVACLYLFEENKYLQASLAAKPAETRHEIKAEGPVKSTTKIVYRDAPGCPKASEETITERGPVLTRLDLDIRPLAFEKQRHSLAGLGVNTRNEALAIFGLQWSRFGILGGVEVKRDPGAFAGGFYRF